MRRMILAFFLCTIMAGAMLITGGVREASAGVNVGIGINLGPPPIVVPAPPEVVMVPSSRVYFVPGVDFDVFFYNGYWWSPRGDRWYRSRAYDGPWRIIDHRYIPGPVYRVPHDYRHRYVGERHIPYRDWREHRHGGGNHGHGGGRGGHGHGHGH